MYAVHDAGLLLRPAGADAQPVPGGRVRRRDADPDLFPAHVADDDAAACGDRAPARDRRLQGVRQLLHPHRRRTWASDRNAEHPRLQDDFRVLEYRPGLGTRGPGVDRVLRVLQLVLSTREEPAEGILKVSG